MVYTTSEAKRAYPGGTASAHEADISKNRLHGLKAISGYAGCSETTLKKRVKEEGFPAAKIGGEWTSHKDKIDMWYTTRTIEKGKKV